MRRSWPSPRRRAGATGWASGRGWPRTRPPRRLRGYRTKVRKIAWGHVIVRAEGDERVRSRDDRRGGRRTGRRPARERTFEVDAVCTAYGFLPSVDLARALGCELGGDAVAHDDDMRTSRRRACSWRARRRGSAAPTSRWPRASSRARLRRRARLDAADAAATPAERRRQAPERRVRSPTTSPRACAARRAKLAHFAGILSDLFDPRPGLLTLADSGHRRSAAARTSPRARSTPPSPAAPPRSRP